MYICIKEVAFDSVSMLNVVNRLKKTLHLLLQIAFMAHVCSLGM